MDQAIIDRAQGILDEWYKASLEDFKHDKPHFRGSLKSQKELIEEVKLKIQNVLEALNSFDEMIRSCTFTTRKPRVNKVRLSINYNWHFEYNRLFVIPIVFANYGKLGSMLINNKNEFKRFGHNQNPIIPYVNLPKESKTKILTNAANKLIIDYHDKTYENRFVNLIHEVYGPRLDELDAQLNQLRDEVGLKLDGLVNHRIEKTKLTESNKFQTKLVKFLKKNPSVAGIDPNLIMSCFKLDPDVLQAMRSFLSVNRSDLAFITKQDIVIAQDLAKIQQVHDS